MLGKDECYIEIVKQLSNDLKQIRRLQYLLANNVFDLDESILKALKARSYNSVYNSLLKRINKDISKATLIALAKQFGILNYSRKSKEGLCQALVESGVKVYD